MDEDNSKKSGPRSSEKRRERSKVAARCRRGRESEIFAELSDCLPLPENLRKTLDKASVARLAATHLKLKGMLSDVFGLDLPEEKVDNGKELDFDQLLNQAMGGFVFVMSADGDVLYISESLTKCLGLSQCEVMGHSILDFAHPCDHGDIKDLLILNKSTPKEQPIPRAAFFRMKCTITSKGRNVHLRAATYKGIRCSGRLYWDEEDPGVRWYIGVGEPLPDPTDVNFPLDKQAFVTRHSMDMKCEDVAGSIQDFMGYKPLDLVGKSFYEFHHAADGGILAKSMKALYAKGQIQTERYRFLAKNGGWVWCITQATVLKSEIGAKDNGIVCLHFITSGVENRHEILSEMQSTAREISMQSIRMEAETIQLPEIIAGLHNPIPSTTKIFAPKTEGMDSGFLVHSDDMLIVSKEEPEDLTHLAPIAGDECIPLCLPLLDDLLRSFDQANTGYTMNGQTVEVDADYLPLYPTIEPQKLNVLPSPLSETSVLLRESQTPSPSSCSDSPLFLNSDPLMGIAMNPSFLPFHPSSSFQGPGDSAEKLITLDEALDDFGGFQDLVSLEDEIGIKLGMSAKESPAGPDELLEFRAPYIPRDGGEDIELLYKIPGYNWPLEPADSGGGTTKLPHQIGETLLTSQQQSLSKLSDQNIDQITWTLDIGSIFAARKAGDQPKVMTRSVFTVLESPPPKVRRMGIVLGSPCLEAPEELNTPTSSCAEFPYFRTCQNMMRLKERDLMTIRNELDEYSSMDLNGIQPPDSGGGYRDDVTSCAVNKNFLRKRDLNGSLLTGGIDGPIPTFYELTQQDYELMVPLVETSLLQGSELLTALDSAGVDH